MAIHPRPIRAHTLALTALVAWAASCAGPSTAVAPDAAKGEVTPAAPGPAAAPEPRRPDPKRMYADCRERVEGAEAPGECASDSDCATAGCGGELCISAANAAAGVSTTCEQRPCFQALDRCTCQATTCKWTVRAEVPALPANARPISLPPKDSEGRVISTPAGEEGR